MKKTQSRFPRLPLVLLLVSLVALGISIRMLVSDYLTESAFARLNNQAQVLCQLTSSYSEDDSMSTMQFIINLDLASRVSGADAFVCDSSGKIILCSDSPTGCDHRSLSLSADYRSRILSSGGTNDTSVLQNLYPDTRYIAARPVYSVDGDTLLGFVVVSAPIAENSLAITRITNLFLFGALLIGIFLLAFATLLSRRQGEPLREMARTARAFGHGEMDARVMLEGPHPEEIEELALAFNNMASSLQKAEYSRQEFVANVSHELKTPMTTIGGYIDGILDGTIPPEKQQHYMKIVSAETKRLSRLVRSMLDISQLQSQGGIGVEQMTRFDVEECAGQMLITFEQKILAKQLNVDVRMPEYPVYTVAHRDYISQVIYNLLDNAVKFCPEGGTLGLKLREGDSKLYLSVSNDGQTIPAEELSLLFDRFHKIDKSRNRSQEGWGLGLYIVKTIVGLHGEDISVTSIDGVTEFTFTLQQVN